MLCVKGHRALAADQCECRSLERGKGFISDRGLAVLSKVRSFLLAPERVYGCLVREHKGYMPINRTMKDGQ